MCVFSADCAPLPARETPAIEKYMYENLQKFK